MSPARKKIACLGRQSGKTAMGGLAAIFGHGPMDGSVPTFRGAIHGARVQWTTKDFPTATRIWRDLKHYLRMWGGELDKSEMERRIGFPGGGALTLRSASDPDSLRGETLDGSVNDELAFWASGALATLRPALAVKQGWEFDISTPDGFDEFFEEWRIGHERADPEYESWQMPSSVNPAFSREEFESIRARTNPNVFAREYLAEFSVTDGSIFRRDWFRGYSESETFLTPEIGEPAAKRFMRTFMCADFALTKKDYSDHTAIAVVSVAPDGRIFMRDLLRIKVTRAQLVPLTKGIQEKWGAVFCYVESSGELANLNEEMRKGGIRIRERKIHQKINGVKGEDKVTRAMEASRAVELAKIFFLHNKQPNGSSAPARWVNDLVAECCAFDGSAGGADDQVDALSLAVLGAPFLVFTDDRQAEERERPKGSWRIGRREE